MSSDYRQTLKGKCRIVFSCMTSHTLRRAVCVIGGGAQQQSQGKDEHVWSLIDLKVDL